MGAIRIGTLIADLPSSHEIAETSTVIEPVAERASVTTCSLPTPVAFTVAPSVNRNSGIALPAVRVPVTVTEPEPSTMP